MRPNSGELVHAWQAWRGGDRMEANSIRSDADSSFAKSITLSLTSHLRILPLHVFEPLLVLSSHIHPLRLHLLETHCTVIHT
jgi:hypothetical protein